MHDRFFYGFSQIVQPMAIIISVMWYVFKPLIAHDYF